MEVFEAIKKRYSCRNYKGDPVPEEKLKKVLEAARLAPSAHNAQDWKFILVKDEKKREEIADAAGQSFLAEAPLIIAAVALNLDYVMPCGVPAHPVDLAIAMEHIALTATEEDLATCWIGTFSQEKVKKVLNIPGEYKVVILMPLGFPADRPKVKIRKNLKEIVSEDNF